jgi:hypothetical protein
MYSLPLPTSIHDNQYLDLNKIDHQQFDEFFYANVKYLTRESSAILISSRQIVLLTF